MRVEALGGFVEFNAVNGELEVSRSVVRYLALQTSLASPHTHAHTRIHRHTHTHTHTRAHTRTQGDSRISTGEKLLGLSAEPEVQVHYLADDDEFIIIACDGLWYSSLLHLNAAIRSLPPAPSTHFFLFHLFSTAATSQGRAIVGAGGGHRASLFSGVQRHPEGFR
jgi:hypothetical protein